jgi:glycosyltransferase involved in cell wall biosynthesis
MSKSPLVTFIIPMYNVDKYIEKCVRSICNQSVSEIEVILINDGSLDISGEIAENLAEQDNRITVIHKENSGVSSTRNLGVDLAKGEYIVFVDGDDHLHQDYTKYMLKIADESCADFVMSRECAIYRDNSDSVYSEVDYEFEEWNNNRAVYELLYPGKVNIGCWNKIFSRGFILENGLKFSTDLYMGEGLKFIIEAAQLANKIAVGHEKVYYYRKDNEDSATTILNVPKYINALKALEVIHSRIVNKTALFYDAISAHQYIAKFYAFRAIQVTGQLEKYQSEFNLYLSDLRKNFPTLLKMDISKSFKLRVLVFCISPILGNLMSKIRK